MITQANSSDTETPDGFRVVEVTREPIELYKILKFEGLVGSGGGAKGVVASGQVLVNGIIETQKRKKLYPAIPLNSARTKFSSSLHCPKTTVLFLH